MEVTKINVDQRINDISDILRIFLYLNPSTGNSQIIYAIEAFYELSLRRQFGEDIPENRKKFLVKFVNYLLRIGGNYSNQLNYINENVKKPLSENPYTKSELRYIAHAFNPNNSRLNALIFLPKIWQQYFYSIDFIHSKIFLHQGDVEEKIDIFITNWLDNFPPMEDNYWLKIYQRLEYYQKKIDECFINSNKIKVVCLKLGYHLDPEIDPKKINDKHLEWSKNRALNHLNIFIKELQHDKRILTSFLKLDFSSNYDFTVFGIFVFKNHNTESMVSLVDGIQNIWQSTFSKLERWEQTTRLNYGNECSIYNTDQYRYLDYTPCCKHISGNITTGVIEKNTDKYNLFIRTTLNYVVNSSKLFEFFIAGVECNYFYHFHNEQLPIEPKVEKSQSKASKKLRKQIEPIAEKFEFGLLKYFKQIQLRKVEEKHIRNIEFMYENLLERYPEIEKPVWQFLAEAEVFVYLLAKWKELPLNPEKSSVNSKTFYPSGDLKQLYTVIFKKVLNKKRLFEILFAKFGLVFNPYLLIAYIALSNIENELKFQEFIKYSDEQLVRFCADIRKILDGSLSDFTNHLEYSLRQVQNLEFKKQILPSIRLYIQSLEESAKKAKTLRGLIESNLEQARRAKSQYHAYWTQKKAFTGANIFISVEVQCANFASNFKDIDGIFKTVIDKLNKDTAIEILAYIGCWDMLGYASHIKSAKITLLFSISKRDIATEMDFIKHFQSKLTFVCEKYNNKKMESNDQVELTLTEDRFSTLIIKRLRSEPLQGEEKISILAWFHYVSQKPLYLKSTLDEYSKRAIKGSASYKKRKKVQKSQLKKFNSELAI